MIKPKLHMALTEIDDRFLSMVDLNEKEIHSMKKPNTRKLFSSLLIAALLVSLFTATAFAISSIHAKEQERLREELQVTENEIRSYLEYLEEGSRGVTLLSSINDGSFQKIYLDVSPVSVEEAERFPETLSVIWAVGDSKGLALPYVRSDRQLAQYSDIHKAILEDSYDAESGTLMLECSIPVDVFAGKDSEELSLALCEETKELRSFGTVTVKATEKETRYFDFGGLVYHDAEHDKDITLLGLELTPVSAVWHFRHDKDEEIHRTRDQNMLVTWGSVEDTVAKNARLHFSDGATFSTGGTMTANFTDGTVACECFWNRTINISDIVRITLDDLVIWEG